MRTFDLSTGADQYVKDLRVVRWEQYGLERELPFQAMWYSVPPGSESPRDQHPELELSVVVAGTAHVLVAGTAHVLMAGTAHVRPAGREYEVPQGNTFLLGPPRRTSWRTAPRTPS